MNVPRISPKDVRRRMAGSSKALLVCAYDTVDRFREMELEGATSWPAFQASLPSVSKDREIVVYCA
jgi:hypothetical protein